MIAKQVVLIWDFNLRMSFSFWYFLLLTVKATFDEIAKLKDQADRNRRLLERKKPKVLPMNCRPKTFFTNFRKSLGYLYKEFINYLINLSAY